MPQCLINVHIKLDICTQKMKMKNNSEKQRELPLSNNIRVSKTKRKKMKQTNRNKYRDWCIFLSNWTLKKVQRTVRFRLIYSFAERLIFRGEKTVAIRRLIWRKRDSRNFDKLMLDSVEGNEADRRQRRARYFAAINSFYALS